MKIYNAAIIGLGPSGLAVNKLIYDNKDKEIIAFENTNIDNRNNFFGFWLTDWMKPFEKLIEKKWNKWVISKSNLEIIHSDKKHPYCVISFKKWKNYCLNTKNNLKIINETVTEYCATENYYKIITNNNKQYFARKIYDSRNSKQRKHEFIQHFYGINITTTNSEFNEDKVKLMHFIEEKNLLHFIYLLPFNKNKALVESTVFSRNVLNEKWYREKIYKYLENLNIRKFREGSEEKGIIPMFFSQEKPSNDPNIYNIGIRGGACKPSTGYAFSFLIKQIQLIKKSSNNQPKVHNLIERKMDKIFLSYLKNNNENGTSFIKLAENLNGTEFQSFMMGNSSFFTKIKIIKSMPKLPFIKAIFN